ncbi:unnamed protein product, partial [Didymodactylos carnosus]
MASIHQVILDGRLSQLTLLIKMDCNVNGKDDFSRTPLHLAALSNQERYGYRVGRVLLQSSADINIQNNQGLTPLAYAIILNRPKLVALFLRTKSIDWRLTDNVGNSHLHYAAMCQNIQILSLIVYEMQTIGLSMEPKNELGYSPLLLAVKNQKYANALFLLDNTDASPFVVDDEYHMNCIQWTNFVEPKMIDNNCRRLITRTSTSSGRRNHADLSFPNYKCWYGIASPYKRKAEVICNHQHEPTFEDSTFTPAILSPRSRSSDNTVTLNKNGSQNPYTMWLLLMQRLHNRCSQLTTPATPDKSKSPTYHTEFFKRENTWSGATEHQQTITTITSPW